MAAAEIDHERLEEDEAGTFFELLVTAGTDTTGAAIAHGLIALCDNADQLCLWQADFAQIAPTAIDEILRWSTPVVHFRRTASADTELCGHDIAAGDKIVLFYNSANRDESVFKAPEQFDVMRNTNPHLTFGGGGPISVLVPTSRDWRCESSSNDCSSASPISPFGVADAHRLHVLQRRQSAPCEFTPRRRKAKS